MIYLRLILVLFSLLGLATCSAANDATHTHEVLPTASSRQFEADTINMLKNENADRYKDMFSPFVASGGLHTTKASLTSDAIATIGYTADGHWVSQVSATITYLDNRTYCWVILDSATSGNLLTFTRVSSTHYMVDCASGTTKPTLPATATWLMRVVTSGGSITAAVSIANPNPILSTTTSASKNVKECGAKVDNVTDDTVALNTCLAIFTHVFVPEGTLLHSGTIVVNIGNRLSGTWTGADAATRTDAALTTYSAAQLALTGSALHYTGAGVAVEASSPTLRDCQCMIDHIQIFSGGGTIGIHFKNLYDIFLDAVNVSGLTYPLTTQGFSTAAVSFEQSLTGTPTPFVGVVRVNNSIFRYTTGYGILGTGGNNLNEFDVTNSKIQGNALGGIRFEGHALSADIGGNDLEGNGGNQLYSFYAAGWAIHGNHMEVSAGNTSPLLRLEHGTGVIVTGGVIAGNPVGAVTPYLIHLGTAGAYTTQAVEIAGVKYLRATAAICLENVRGAYIHENISWVDIGREISTCNGNIEGVSWKSMTRDIIGGQPSSVVESTSTVYGMNTIITSFASSTAENTLYSVTVPGKTLRGSTNMAGELRLQLHGGSQNGSGVPSDLILRVKYGGVTLSVLRWAAIAPAGGVYALSLKGHISGSAIAVNNQECEFTGMLGGPTTVANTVINAAPVLRFSVCDSAVAGADMSVDQTLTVTAQMSANDPLVAVFRSESYLVRYPY